jgi:putative ABC transport system permease protein
VARRTREMGVRLALGATPGSVRLMVIRESVVVVAIGLMAGLPLANILTRYVRHLLYGVEPSDPVAMLVAVGLLLATALIAASLPAQRASRVDPVIALRSE